MKALEVTDLRKTYGKLEALKGVSFEVEPGEVLGYLGPNGAGKTTTMRIILGLVYPTGGEVRLFGNQSRLTRARVSLGYLPGELHLYDDMTGRALLTYFARYRPSRPPALREKLLKAFDLGPAVLSRKVKFLSHGTRQKIGLILAMQHDPEILLLDEPTLGLDPLVQQVFREVIADFAARGRAVFLSSHILSEVEDLCHRVALLRSGEMLAVESIGHLRRKMVRRLQLRFRSAVPQDLLETPGVTRLERSSNGVTLWIQGDVNPLLRAIAQVDIDDIVFPEAELQDIFLSYYRPEGSRHG